MDQLVYFFDDLFYHGEWLTSGFFRSSRGLRQDDPISPYLFVLGMEDLSCLLAKVVDGCSFGGRWRGELIISHLLYVDDTILFCEAKQDQLAYLSWLLMWFEAISRLKINLSKSEIILVGSVDNVKELAFELGCKIRALSSSYLGLPLGAQHNSIVV